MCRPCSSPVPTFVLQWGRWRWAAAAACLPSHHLESSKQFGRRWITTQHCQGAAQAKATAARLPVRSANRGAMACTRLLRSLLLRTRLTSLTKRLVKPPSRCTFQEDCSATSRWRRDSLLGRTTRGVGARVMMMAGTRIAASMSDPSNTSCSMRGLVLTSDMKRRAWPTVLRMMPRACCRIGYHARWPCSISRPHNQCGGCGVGLLTVVHYSNWTAMNSAAVIHTAERTAAVRLWLAMFSTST